MTGWGDKNTNELIILLFAVSLCAVFVLIGGGIFFIILWKPEYDVRAIAAAYGNLISSVIGAVLGFLAGRGRREPFIDRAKD